MSTLASRKFRYRNEAERINDEHIHYENNASPKKLSVSIEGALAVLLYMNRTLSAPEAMNRFMNCSEGNTLHATVPLAEDHANAADIFSYWENKFFLAKLSDDITLTSWRKKLLHMCSNRHSPMMESYHKILITLPRITSYEKRTDIIAEKYVSHDYLVQQTNSRDLEELELHLIEKYRHDTKRQKAFVYRLADNQNKVYELSVARDRDSQHTMSALVSAASAFDAIFTITGSVRLNGIGITKPLNNVLHDKFLYKELQRITSITPIAVIDYEY